MPDGQELNRQLAEQDYIAGMKYREIAEKYGTTINTVKSWAKRHNWSREKGAHKTEKGCTQNKGAETSRKMPEIDKALTDPLNENQRFFCEIYVHNRNATQAYINAYGATWATANVNGPRLLVDTRIRAYVEELLRIKRESIFFEPDDLIEKQMKIAFSDINDFLEFGREVVPVMGPFGPVTAKNPDTGKKEIITKLVNTVRFKESCEVDGSLINQVKMGKDGASIKLQDQQKALDWLANYFMLNPADRHKQEFDRRKLEIEEREIKLKEDKEHGVTKDIDAIRDGLKDLFESIGSPVPNRVIEDE